jgi:replication-associated recombination protein RarA
MSVQNAFEAYFVDLTKGYSINKKISTYLKVKCLNHSILYTPMGTTKANMSHLLKADEMTNSFFYRYRFFKLTKKQQHEKQIQINTNNPQRNYKRFSRTTKFSKA